MRVDELKRELDNKTIECDAKEKELDNKATECDAIQLELDYKTIECDAKQRYIDQLLKQVGQVCEPIQLSEQQQASELKQLLETRKRKHKEVKVAIHKRVTCIDQDPILSAHLRNFFYVLEKGVPTSAVNSELNLYDQFLFDHPKEDKEKAIPNQHTRDEVARAMHIVCGCPSDFENKKRKMQAQHGNNVRVCRKSFARCLAALGGVAKCIHGVNYWINVGMRRKPYYAWSV